MICRKCSFILQGSEKFCPNCGADCSQKPQTEKEEDILTPPPSVLFSAPKEQREAPPEIQQRIFREEPTEDEEEKTKPKKSKAPAILVSVLVIVILLVGGFTAMEYLGLAPVIMQYLETGNTVGDSTEGSNESTSEHDTTEAIFSSSYGIVSPDINFKPTICYVATDKSLTLRKGPDDSYAPVETLETGCQLQVIGASNLNDTWVYAFVPTADSYGWLSSSFLSEASSLNENEEETTVQSEESTENP